MHSRNPKKTGIHPYLRRILQYLRRECIGKVRNKREIIKGRFWILVKEILELCEENELKNMKIDYLDENDWKYK